MNAGMSTANDTDEVKGLPKILQQFSEKHGVPVHINPKDENTHALAILAILEKIKETPERAAFMLEIAKHIKQTETDLENEISIDKKTGLHSQKFFDDRLRYTIERLKRAGTGTATLIAIDLNDFSAINNEYGHHIGDKALLAWANIIGQLPRSIDVVARSNTAGDEFFVLFEPETKEQVSGEPGHEAAVERFKKGVANVFIDHAGQRIHITGSLGIVQVTAKDTVEIAKERADAAMYEAKTEFKQRRAANNNEASAPSVPSHG